MDLLGFFTRHTPFWSIPMAFIAFEFGYKYWLKRRKVVYRTCFFIGLCGLSMTAIYIWAGGPEKTPEKVLHFLFIE
jgi:hypothetical protein